MKGRVEKLGPDFRHLKSRLRARRKSDWPSPSISLTLLITLSCSVVSTFTDDVPKSSPFRWCSRVLVFPPMCQSLSLPTDTTFHSCGLWRGLLLEKFGGSNMNSSTIFITWRIFKKETRSRGAAACATCFAWISYECHGNVRRSLPRISLCNEEPPVQDECTMLVDSRG